MSDKLTTTQHLSALWHRHFTPPDDRPIWQWIAEEGELPHGAYAVPGRLDVELVPFIKGPLAALRDPRVREVTCMAGVQCLKTLCGEMWLLWSIANSPGPTQWLQGTDMEAKEHALERFLSLVDAFPILRNFFTGNRHHLTTTFLRFKHMYLRMEGVDNPANLQRKSIRNQMRSEVWQRDYWKPGKIKEAMSRQTQFVHNSKGYTESQAGWIERDEDGEIIGDDLTLHYLSGTQEVWQFPCLSCGKFQPYHWSVVRSDNSRAGVRWEDSERTRRGRKWIWSQVAQTIRYECMHCGHPHPDDLLTRNRMNRLSKEICQNTDTDGTHRSFTWNQLAVPTLSWFESKYGGVKNFLLATEQSRAGYDLPLREFFQKVVAEPWDEQRQSHFMRLPVLEIQSDPSHPSDIWSKPHVVVLTIDVQLDHFWFLVLAWAEDGDFLILDFGKSFSWSDLEARQQQWKVNDQDVMVDCQHERAEVIFQCAVHGHWSSPSNDGRAKLPLSPNQSTKKYWLCWKALEGTDLASFTYKPRKGKNAGRSMPLPYSWPPQMAPGNYGLRHDDPRRQQARGLLAPVIRWSNPTVKDIAKKLRDQMAAGKRGAIKSYPSDKSDKSPPWSDELSKHLYAETKRPVQDRQGFTKLRWGVIGKRPNHGFDLFCMAIVRGLMLRRVVEPMVAEVEAEE